MGLREGMPAFTSSLARVRFEEFMLTSMLIIADPNVSNLCRDQSKGLQPSLWRNSIHIFDKRKYKICNKNEGQPAAFELLLYNIYSNLPTLPFTVGYHQKRYFLIKKLWQILFFTIHFWSTWMLVEWYR